MVHLKIFKKFDEQLAALEVVVLYLCQAVNLLRRSVEGQISLPNKKENDLLRLVLTHYIINNLASLFDEGRRINSLMKICSRFEKNFPNDFFLEYIAFVEKFHIKHTEDLKRIEKNRHLSTAHLGADEREQLGWSPQVAKNMDELLGTQSPVAQEYSLQFITPFQLFEMSIMQEIPELKSVLKELRAKVIFNEIYKQH